MTIRTAELLMAILLALLSAALMYKSTQGLSIGWISGSGPGSGMWPFWLSTGMLISCLATILRWFFKMTPESRSSEAYMSKDALKIVGVSVLALVALLVGTHVIGVYISAMLFLLFYVRLMGKHSWPTTVGLVVATPVGLFVFFDWALKSPLPKGVSEPLFYPLYNFIY